MINFVRKLLGYKPRITEKDVIEDFMQSDWKDQIRTDRDYAIEHAEYLAQAAERFLECCNDLTDIEELVIRPNEVFSDMAGGLRIAIFEFRKRKERAHLGEK